MCQINSVQSNSRSRRRTNDGQRINHDTKKFLPVHRQRPDSRILIGAWLRFHRLRDRAIANGIAQWFAVHEQFLGEGRTIVTNVNLDLQSNPSFFRWDLRRTVKNLVLTRFLKRVVLFRWVTRFFVVFENCGAMEFESQGYQPLVGVHIDSRNRGAMSFLGWCRQCSRCATLQSSTVTYQGFRSLRSLHPWLSNYTAPPVWSYVGILTLILELRSCTPREFSWLELSRATEQT